jgi:hypothetical protein
MQGWIPQHDAIVGRGYPVDVARDGGTIIRSCRQEDLAPTFGFAAYIFLAVY